MDKTCAVKLVSVTKTEREMVDEIGEGGDNEFIESPEGLMGYIARVSSPNQTNPNYTGLLKYCIQNKHWSVFEMCDMTVEVTTSRGISPQILRHRSFNFSEFSQRYAKVGQGGIIIYKARRQDSKDRQNSIDDLSEDTQQWFKDAQKEVWDLAYARYEQALERGIAKECARFLLPLNTKTKLYMKGSLRSWIHYIEVRADKATQLEHREIAIKVKEIFIQKFPTVAKALEWA